MHLPVILEKVPVKLIGPTGGVCHPGALKPAAGQGGAGQVRVRSELFCGRHSCIGHSMSTGTPEQPAPTCQAGHRTCAMGHQHGLTTGLQLLLAAWAKAAPVPCSSWQDQGVWHLIVCGHSVRSLHLQHSMATVALLHQLCPQPRSTPCECVLALALLPAMPAGAGPRVVWLLVRAGAGSCGAGTMGLADGVPTSDQGNGLRVIHVLRACAHRPRHGRASQRHANNTASACSTADTCREAKAQYYAGWQGPLDG